MRRIRTIEDVVQFQLCTGCGACVFAEPNRYYMENVYDLGLRPFIKADAVQETGEALACCPGIELIHDESSFVNTIEDLQSGWGPVLDVWEGYAENSEIRFDGSSGGVSSALALFLMEKKEFGQTLHIKENPNKPHLNQSTVSKSRSDILKTTGSRYAPASPCDNLGCVSNCHEKSVFIGKPCDVAAVSKIKQRNREIAEKLDVSIAFFCAGTPSTEGTLKLLEADGVTNPENVRSLRYRGKGWPGKWSVTHSEAFEGSKVVTRTYHNSWSFLQKFRQWRCYICPDHTGEFADISVGDPWYREVEPGEHGKSLIVARTEKGKQIILEAAATGYISLSRNNQQMLPDSQPNLLKARGALWGRLIALKVMGAATPRFVGFDTFAFWVANLSAKEKLQSLFGTVRRVFIKKLNRRIIVKNKIKSHNEKSS